MKHLIAIHEVVCDDENGKSVAVAPGKAFSVSDEVAALLLEAGAAKSDDAPVSVQGEEVVLSKLNKAQLLALAEDRKVAVDPEATKAVIIAALEVAEDSII
jgi:hypothetical protein